MRFKPYTPEKITAHREQLGLSVAEAAEHLGSIKPARWLEAEQGIKELPKRASYQMAEWMLKVVVLKLHLKAFPAPPHGGKINLPLYETEREAGGLITWRYWNKVLADTAAAEPERFVLVPFPAADYHYWRGTMQLADSPDTRWFWLMVELNGLDKPFQIPANAFFKTL